MYSPVFPKISFKELESINGALVENARKFVRMNNYFCIGGGSSCGVQSKMDRYLALCARDLSTFSTDLQTVIY